MKKIIIAFLFLFSTLVSNSQLILNIDLTYKLNEDSTSFGQLYIYEIGETSPRNLIASKYFFNEFTYKFELNKYYTIEFKTENYSETWFINTNVPEVYANYIIYYHIKCNLADEYTETNIYFHQEKQKFIQKSS
jgi:hypothetical protein